MYFRGNVHVNNKVCRLPCRAQNAGALTGLVGWTCVLFGVSHVVFLRLEPNQGHLVVQLSWNLIVNDRFVPVVSSTVQEESVYVHTVFRSLVNFVD